MSNFFSVMIDGVMTNLEKNRIIAIEPSAVGTKIIMEASHTEEEPIIYILKEEYEDVVKSYSS